MCRAAGCLEAFGTVEAQRDAMDSCDRGWGCADLVWAFMPLGAAWHPERRGECPWKKMIWLCRGRRKAIIFLPVVSVAASTPKTQTG